MGYLQQYLSHSNTIPNSPEATFARDRLKEFKARSR